MVNATKQFTIGQKVKLNSGSPELTVLKTGDRTTVEWLDGAKTCTADFAPVCLTGL